MSPCPAPPTHLERVAAAALLAGPLAVPVRWEPRQGPVLVLRAILQGERAQRVGDGIVTLRECHLGRDQVPDPRPGDVLALGRERWRLAEGDDGARRVARGGLWLLHLVLEEDAPDRQGPALVRRDAAAHAGEGGVP